MFIVCAQETRMHNVYIVHLYVYNASNSFKCPDHMVLWLKQKSTISRMFMDCDGFRCRVRAHTLTRVRTQCIHIYALSHINALSWNRRRMVYTIWGHIYYTTIHSQELLAVYERSNIKYMSNSCVCVCGA